MSDAFSTTPTPNGQDSLDFDLSNEPNQGGRKFSCEAGEYAAFVSKLEPVKGKDGQMRVKFEVTLTAPDVKGIRAQRLYDTSGQYAWSLEKAAEVFGVLPVDTGRTDSEGKPIKQLQLGANKLKIIGAEVIATVKPRKWTGNDGVEREGMDLVKLAAAPAKAPDSSVPF